MCDAMATGAAGAVAMSKAAARNACIVVLGGDGMYTVQTHDPRRGVWVAGGSHRTIASANAEARNTRYRLWSGTSGDAPRGWRC